MPAQPEEALLEGRTRTEDDRAGEVVRGTECEGMVDFYGSKRWAEKRAHILRRDRWIDQVMLRQGVKIEANTVHHILPRERWPQYQWCDWNLISVNTSTHKQALHEKFSGKLTKFGWRLARETAAAQGIKIKMTTMVIGFPGSGKTTWTRDHMGGGIAYDMDAIANAFRLGAGDHSGARQMAAALRRGWIEAAREYADDIYIIRMAPDERELDETNPDRLVVCTGRYERRPYKIDEADTRERINNAIEWAKLNGVELVEAPPRSTN